MRQDNERDLTSYHSLSCNQ